MYLNVRNVRIGKQTRDGEGEVARNVKPALRSRPAAGGRFRCECDGAGIVRETDIPGIPRCGDEPECRLSRGSAVVLTLINSLSYQLQSETNKPSKHAHTHTHTSSITSAIANSSNKVLE